MSAVMDPLNFGLLIPTKSDLQGMQPTEVMDIMDGLTKNFHPRGLFSVEIFGKVGEERRSRSFSYIILNAPILHPLIYKVLVDLKEMYGQIAAGKTYAIFDPKLKDFVKSNPTEGETGYAFLLEHFKDLKFEERSSISRTEYIKFMEMHRDDPYISQLVVMPAGLRDYVVDETGKPSEDEINAMYRSIMAVASNMENINVSVNPEHLNEYRYNLQIKVVELYKYIMSLVFGKHKMIQGSWMSRKITNSTRNVISSHIPATMSLGDDKHVDPNTTVVGLFQFLRMIMPLTVFFMTNRLRGTFTGPNTPGILTDPKTLLSKTVGVNPRTYDQWMTYEGIEKLCARFAEESMRHYPIMIGEHYLGLVYRGPDKTFRFLRGIDELPEGRLAEHCTPITMAELMYMCVYEYAQTTAVGYATRYPVERYGSKYPTRFALRTTVRSDVFKELDESWNPLPVKAVSFPINGVQFFNSMSPSVSHVPRQGADYDGDQESCWCVFTDEAIAEINRILDSRDYYLTLDGEMAFSQNNDYISLCLKYLTMR